MKHLLIRPESKLKNKIGRGTTVVMYDTINVAAYHILLSLLDTHGFVDQGFDLRHDLNTDQITIEAVSDHDYYRWLDLLNSKVYHMTVEQDEALESKPVAGVDFAYRYQRNALELLGFDEELTTLQDVANIQLVRSGKPNVGEMEPVVPLTEIIGYGDQYDLPVGGYRPTSWLGRLFSFFGEMAKNTENLPIATRSPFVVFESYLGGHIAVYKSITTDKEVDVALFNRYGNLINVFSFQDGCPHRNGINGFTIEDLISIGSWRILHLNNSIAADENVKAVYHLNEAVEQLGERTRKRAEELLNQEGA